MAIRLGVIGGREVGELLRQGLVGGERRYVINTPYGDAQPIYLVATSGRTYYVLPRPGDDEPPPAPSAVNYRANVYALRELGVQTVLVWSGPAALTADLAPGRFVLPDGLVDLTRRGEHTFFDRSARGRLRQAPAFCPTLKRICKRALADLDLEVTTGGTYVCTEGPRLETPEEAALFASWGGTLVGQTLCPEAFLARELDMCYAPLCIVTGHAEGLARRTFVTGSLYRGLADDGHAGPVEAAARRFPEVIDAVLAALAEEPEDWPCRAARLADRDPSLIDTDWHDRLRG